MGKARRRKRAGTYPTARERDEIETELKRTLVELANATAPNMDGTSGPVLELIADNDMVYGVWQEPAEKHGVGILLIKGANRLREITATGTPTPLSMTAIRCTCLEQAEALRQHVNTDPIH